VDIQLKESFLRLWEQYFGAADLPMVFYYTNEHVEDVEWVKPPSGHQCIMAQLTKVTAGRSLGFSVDAVGCFGGKRYLGFSQEIAPNFEYFLSCGIPGKLEGERYKKTPEMVKELMGKLSKFEAPGQYIVFKRWDRLVAGDEPEVVVFLARPDVLSGLFTLANFDVSHPDGVFCPFAAGCGSIVQYPYLEGQSDHPRAVVGMFDVSARPCVPADVLSFSVPVKKFVTMVNNADESFLITPSWAKVQKRIERSSIGRLM